MTSGGYLPYPGPGPQFGQQSYGPQESSRGWIWAVIVPLLLLGFVFTALVIGIAAAMCSDGGCDDSAIGWALPTIVLVWLANMAAVIVLGVRWAARRVATAWLVVALVAQFVLPAIIAVVTAGVSSALGQEEDATPQVAVLTV